MPLLEKYAEGDRSEFARHELSKASLSQYLTATVDAPDGDYTIKLLLDKEGNPNIHTYLLNGRELTDTEIINKINTKAAKFHGLNQWIPAQVDLNVHPSVMTIAFDRKTKPCPEALYSLRSIIQEGPCNQYFCSKKDLIEFFDYYDSDFDSWNYIGEKEKNSLRWTIFYPGKKDEMESIILEQIPTEEQWETLKKKLPKKGKIEIERSMFGSDTRFIAVNLE